MKTRILVGAAAALLYGGVALAQGNEDCPPGYVKKDTSASVDSQAVQDESLSVIETEPVDPAIGGSGEFGVDQEGLDVSGEAEVDAEVREGEAFGGGGREGMDARSDFSRQQHQEMLLRCEPVESGAAVGGSGAIDDRYGSDSIGGSGFQQAPLREPQAEPVTPAPTSDAFIPANEREERPDRESRADMRGITLMVGGGVEGYSGALATQINPGAAYGVTASIKPSKVLGIELGYNGAMNEIDTRVGAGVGTDGPDLVRNGGQAAVTLGLGAAPVQPYLLGGLGISSYNFRGDPASGFSDDTVGSVPVGVGLRTHIGNFTADLRANYNFLFDQEFAAGVNTGFNETGRYTGTLNIGGTF
jgi:hypothetical protein